MSNFDKTRQNIGAGNLSDRERKEMFNKFVDSGGQVVADKKKKAIAIDRNKQREALQKMETRKKEYAAQQKKRPPVKTQNATTAIKNRQKVASSASAGNSFLDKLTIRFKLWLQGTSNFAVTLLKPGYLERFTGEYKSALLEIQLVYLEIFKTNPGTGEKIIFELDGLKPLYYELLEYAAALFDKPAIENISTKYLSRPGIAHGQQFFRDPMIALFRKLYILYPYQELIYVAFEKATQAQAKHSGEKSSVYAQRRKRVKNSIYVLYNKLFPRLYWLFCFWNNSLIQLVDASTIEQLLEISPDQKPGNRVAHQQSKFDPVTGEIIEEEELPGLDELLADKQEEPEVDDSIKRGLKIMANIDLEPIKRDLEHNELLKNVPAGDKVLRTYHLFHFFDREYSFILTTNKVKYNTVDTPNGRIDYRAKLADTYNRMRGCLEMFKEYFNSLDIYYKMRAERPLTRDQYFKHSKRLAELESELRLKADNARHSVATFMQQVNDHLEFLIEDMDKAQRIVVNPQETLTFDAGIEKNRELKDKKVYEGIGHIRDFSAALIHRLSRGEDLHGKIDTLVTAADNNPPEDTDSTESATPSNPDQDLL